MKKTLLLIAGFVIHLFFSISSYSAPLVLTGTTLKAFSGSGEGWTGALKRSAGNTNCTDPYSFYCTSYWIEINNFSTSSIACTGVIGIVYSSTEQSTGMPVSSNNAVTISPGNTKVIVDTYSNDGTHTASISGSSVSCSTISGGAATGNLTDMNRILNWADKEIFRKQLGATSNTGARYRTDFPDAYEMCWPTVNTCVGFYQGKVFVFAPDLSFISDVGAVSDWISTVQFYGY